MILVLLGTQNNSFHRLLEEVEKNIENGTIKEEVIAQKGYTKFESNKIKLFDEVPLEEMKKLINKANIIITHGGVGSIITAITKGKKVIAVPRLKKYKEHVNDHQTEIVEAFNREGYIIGIQDVSELEDALRRIKEFTPKKYEKNTGNIIKIIEDFIEKNWFNIMDRRIKNSLSIILYDTKKTQNYLVLSLF